MSRGKDKSFAIAVKIEVSALTEFAEEPHALVPPTVSEKNFVESDAICCSVAQAEIEGESVEQLDDAELLAP